METLLTVLLFYYQQILLGNPSKEIIQDYIAVEALIYGVDPQMALHIANNESQFNPHPKDGDTTLICRTTGKSMRSRGLWQWNTCGHEDISDDEAYNIIISTNLALQEMKKNGCGIWKRACDSYKPYLSG